MSLIGEWLVLYNVAHLIESEIAARAVTRCGRQLDMAKLRPAGHLALRCKQCAGRIS